MDQVLTLHNPNYIVYPMDNTTYVSGVRLNIPFLSGDVDDKINSFAKLPVGWDYGGGGPISDQIVQTALAWKSLLATQFVWDIDAFAGGDGEILIAASCGDHYVEVIIEPDSSISMGYDFKGKQIFYRPRMSSWEAFEQISVLWGNLWSAYGYFTQRNTIQRRVDLHDWHLGIHPLPVEMGHYQSSSVTVFDPIDVQSANILDNTTRAFPALLGNLRFFGNSTPRFFLGALQ
jgi:hypothetical protein